MADWKIVDEAYRGVDAERMYRKGVAHLMLLGVVRWKSSVQKSAEITVQSDHTDADDARRS